MYKYEAQARSLLDVRVVNGKEAMAMCPFHDNRHTPSLQVNFETGLWVCFVCDNPRNSKNLGGSIKKLAAMLGRKYTEPEVAAKELRRMIRMLEEEENKPVSHAVKVYPESYLNRFAVGNTGYWTTERGFTPETVAAWELGFDMLHDAATIPVRDYRSRLRGVTLRYLSGDIKYQYPAGFPRRHDMFGSWKFKGGKVALVEGALDAIYCWQAGVPALAQYGSSLTEGQARLMVQLGATEVVLMHDNDKAGHKARKKAAAVLHGVVVHTPPYPTHGGKDPGEWTNSQIKGMFHNPLADTMTG